MASLQFTVFEGASEVALGDPVQEGVITISGTSAQGAAISGENRKRRRVRVFTDTDCFINWGDNPTALNDFTGGRAMPAEGTEYFDIEAGHKLAVIERV